MRVVNDVMNRLILVAAMFLCFFCFATASYSVENAAPAVFFDMNTYVSELQRTVDKVNPGIVMIVFYDSTGEESGSGSGFFIDRSGNILTNAYITGNVHSAEVFSESNHYKEVVLMNRDEDLDLVLLKVDANDELSLKIDFNNKARPGEKVIIVGKTRSMEKTVSKGEISEVKVIEEPLEFIKILTISTLSFQSSKDGPLLNMDGTVIGISTTRSLDNTVFGADALRLDDKTMQAVSASSIKSFLSEPGETERLQPARSRMLSDYLVWKIEKIAEEVFVTLYQTGFSSVIIIVFSIILLISLVQWLYFRVKKRFMKKEI